MGSPFLIDFKIQFLKVYGRLGLNASILPCNCRDEFFVNVCTCVCIINVMVYR